MSIDVRPISIDSMPILTISPIRAVDKNSIFEINRVTIESSFYWQAQKIKASSPIQESTLPPNKQPFEFKFLVTTIFLVKTSS